MLCKADVLLAQGRLALAVRVPQHLLDVARISAVLQYQRYVDLISEKPRFPDIWLPRSLQPQLARCTAASRSMP